MLVSTKETDPVGVGPVPIAEMVAVRGTGEAFVVIDAGDRVVVVGVPLKAKGMTMMVAPRHTMPLKLQPIDAVPEPAAVTSPDELTAATFWLEVVQFTEVLRSAARLITFNVLPSLYLAVPVSCTVSPSLMIALDGVTLSCGNPVGVVMLYVPVAVEL